MLGYFPPKSEEKTSAVKTSTNATVSTTTANSDPIYYKVRSRDTMTKIAIQYKTTVKEIMALNPDIKNANTIYPGQRIRIK